MEAGENKAEKDLFEPLEKFLMRLTWVLFLLSVIQVIGFDFMSHDLKMVVSCAMIVFAAVIFFGSVFFFYLKIAARGKEKNQKNISDGSSL